ncbi:MAG: co-chaperone DjlA [Gammaproteobacteria bacterium]|jgi:DnaJ like chaperone protein|nr:co-chaperone DjlA [Gammaproteobacteria bacterium]
MRFVVAGKLVAGLIGLLTGGFIGLVIGLIVGHFFDRALGRAFQFVSPENIQRIRDSFFETTFRLSGFLAKADGRVSEQEIAHTEQVFVQLGLNAEQRKRAIECFREGSAADFDPEATVSTFVAATAGQRQLVQTLLLFLISLAHADGTMEPPEHAVLVRISSLLGISAVQLDALLKMAQAQGQFHGSAGRQHATSADAVTAAYSALGISSSVSDKELKRAYRKLMSEHHPDKLIARGVPEEMIKVATERSQDIQAAYETVQRHRGLKT